MKFPKRWPLNTGDCLIEATAYAGLTVEIIKPNVFIGIPFTFQIGAY